jgi:hypothetical protein
MRFFYGELTFSFFGFEVLHENKQLLSKLGHDCGVGSQFYDFDLIVFDIGNDAVLLFFWFFNVFSNSLSDFFQLHFSNIPGLNVFFILASILFPK